MAETTITIDNKKFIYQDKQDLDRVFALLKKRGKNPFAYMYMYSDIDRRHFFKHYNTREYINIKE